MSGFDHSALAAQLAANIAYVAPTKFRFGALCDLPATSESLDPTETAYDKHKSNNVIVRLTFSRALFAGKLPAVNQAFTDSVGRVYRIHGGPERPQSDPLVSFVCGYAAALP
ncbi:hypothetical protein [Oleiharenicola lentus]|uniref:hypothetical protein n=1 Tax=Oleiharenicola lentus TaxID=2508720 RepID=UPI003F668D2D